MVRTALSHLERERPPAVLDGFANPIDAVPKASSKSDYVTMSFEGYCRRLSAMNFVIMRAYVSRRRDVWKARCASGRGGGSPRPERFVSQDAERAAGCEMALDVESVLDGGMSGQEALS
jgi:hypothetical protein